MEATVQVNRNGMLPLPDGLRELYGIKYGDTFRMLDIDGTFVLTRKPSIVSELAREIEIARIKAGMETEDMLKGLREERERYFIEKYVQDTH